MTFRTMSLSVFVAFGLLFSASSAMLAQADDTETIQTTLNDSLVCSIDVLTPHAGGNFGEFQWDPASSSYVRVTSFKGFWLWGTYLTNPTGGCDITVSFSGLQGPGGVIDPTHFDAWSVPLNNPMYVSRDPAGWTELDFPGPTYKFTYELREVPNTVSPGTYTGAIKIVVANAA